MKVLVTGATGFVGKAFVTAALQEGWTVRAALRTPAILPIGCESIVVGELGPETNWQEALKGCDTVVHLAARVHVMKETVADPAAVFDTINTQGTISLAKQAAAAGIARFLFMSTIKVNGEGRTTPYTEQDTPNPEDPYAISKLACEKALFEIAARTQMAVTVLRPPLIYGPHVKANFLKLLQNVDRGLPLPFADVHNARSLLFVGNLVSGMIACLTSDGAKNQTFLITDGAAISTPELIRATAKALKRPCRLWPFPVVMMRIVARLVGKGKQVSRLFGSLAADSSALTAATQWSPPYTLEQGLADTARWYKTRKKC